MTRLVLTQELAEQLAAALLAVIRADHEIQPNEGRAVQQVVSEMVDNVTVDFADAMLARVSPESFARAVGAARGGGPHRGLSVSPPQQIARAFREAAERVAGADGNIGRSEARVVDRYVDALNVLHRAD
jgi:uncharacterized tellurite resistance protein B-like protein